jgi:hypothetical protein
LVSRTRLVALALAHGDLQVAGVVAEVHPDQLAVVAVQHDPAGHVDDGAAVGVYRAPCPCLELVIGRGVVVRHCRGEAHQTGFGLAVDGQPERSHSGAFLAALLLQLVHTLWPAIRLCRIRRHKCDRMDAVRPVRQALAARAMDTVSLAVASVSQSGLLERGSLNRSASDTDS